MTECPFCKGDIEHKTIDRYIRSGEQHVLVRNVPVEVCQRCGETFVAPGTSEQLDRVVEANNALGEPTINVPVRDFSALEEGVSPS